MAHSIELDAEKAAALRAGARAMRRGELAAALERYAALVLVVLAVLGFGLRASGISRIGFAEDEINKVEAVRAYERGDITPNAEHPMVMKAFIYASMRAARVWNAQASAAAAAGQISDEMAVRFPNILFGALTVFPLFLLTAAFFNRRTALVAAALWAFGVNAITVNRTAKEDTLLVFFMLFAFYFFLRAKQTSGFEFSIKRRDYILSAVAFGLMLASKYFPHYFGLNMLYYHLVHVRRREPGEPQGSTPTIFYFVLPLAFLIANPALFFPATWDYLTAYSGEQLLTHHGYLMGATLYDNVMSKTPFGGTPVYFYLLFLLIKTPLPLLFALVAGLIVIARRWREPGAAFLLLMFVLWIVPYSLVGAKWLRYSLSLMPLVYMIAAVGIVALVGWTARTWGDANRSSGVVRVALGVAATLVFVVWPAWTAYANRPHYALYTNALAASRAGYFFPHDEFYDDGLREALEFVCTHAPQGATVAHETPGVARYYLEKYGRADLSSRVLSDPQFDPLASRPGTTYIVLQRGRTYFENREKMAAVRGSEKFVKVYEGIIGGVSAVEVYASRADGE